MRLLDQPDDLQLFGSRISHSSSAPSAIMLFLSRRNSRACSATTSFSAWACRRRSVTSPLVAARAVSPARRRLPASRNSFDGVIQALGNPFASAQLRNAVLAAKAIENDADFLLGRILPARRSANVSYDPLG